MAAWASSRISVGLAAGGEGALVVGVALEQIVLDALEGLAGDLGAAGVVEKYSGTVEGREVFADEGKIEGHKGLLGLIITFLGWGMQVLNRRWEALLEK